MYDIHDWLTLSCCGNCYAVLLLGEEAQQIQSAAVPSAWGCGSTSGSSPAPRRSVHMASHGAEIYD